MKNFKKIASAIAALSLAACMVAPVATMTSFAEETKGSITITNPTGVKHTYEAYQIFSGKLDESGKILTDIKWANGVSASALVDALQSESLKIEYKTPAAEGVEETVVSNANPFKDVPDYDADNDKSAKAVADILSTLTPNGVKQFLTVVATNLASSPTSSVDAQISQGEKYGDVTINNLDPGYYFIKDKDSSLAEQDDAYTRYMVQVLGTVSTIAPKSEKPSVDKQVLDNDSDDATTDPTKGNATESDLAFTGGTWCETADHAINEKFNFKLKATLPESTEFDEYKTYKLVFHDTMSKGVTYDGIKSVVIKKGENSITIPLKEESKAGYEVVQTEYVAEPEANATLTVTIEDLKAFLDDKITSISGVTVEVIYEAHLNENATVSKTNVTSSDNANDVYLEYSNNPNVTGDGNPSTDIGKTPKDTVWVFTYEVDSKKTAGDKAPSDNALPGAEFQLRKGGTDGTIIKFIDNEDGTYTVADQTKIVAPTGDPKIVNTVVSYTTGGTFNFVGLDAGTYTLVETKAPDGYNIAAPVTITVTATHKEESDETNSGTLVIKQDETEIINSSKPTGGVLEIVDEKGATLPSTGGIGTTLFYLGGGALVAVAGVMLITKKRMTKE